jgi:osmotically-inducible protein OsmY
LLGRPPDDNGSRIPRAAALLQAGGHPQMTLADTRMRREVQKELVKRDIESNLINVQVINSIVYLTGEMRAVRGMILDLRKEKDLIEEIIRGMKGVRDVINQIKVPL